MSLSHRLTPRPMFALLAAACFGLLGFGLILQSVEQVEPCPMCIMQRYAFATVGLLALLAALLVPRGRALWGWCGAIALAAATGLGIAARQSWLQWYPPEFAECGPGLEFMLNSFPLAQVLPMIFQGSGDCSKVDWTFLGLSIANWALLAFAGTLIWLAALLRLEQRRTRRVFSR